MMQTEPRISFPGLPIDHAVRDAVLDHVAQLERLWDRITGCHVVISQPHRHQRSGRLYSVRIELVVPGAEIVVNRDHHLDHAHEDPLVAVRDAFLALRRRLEDHVRRLHGVEKIHVARARGRVSRLPSRADHGFIATGDGRDVYFHRHAVSARDARRIGVGSEVFFTEEEGDEGPQATFVQLVHPHHPHPAPGPVSSGETP